MAYRVSLGICLQIWQQLTGMNIIMFYVVFMFEQAGKYLYSDPSQCYIFAYPYVI